MFNYEYLIYKLNFILCVRKKYCRQSLLLFIVSVVHWGLRTYSPQVREDYYIVLEKGKRCLRAPSPGSHFSVPPYIRIFYHHHSVKHSLSIEPQVLQVNCVGLGSKNCHHQQLKANTQTKTSFLCAEKKDSRNYSLHFFIIPCCLEFVQGH